MRALTVAITVLLAWALPSAAAQAGVPGNAADARASNAARPGLVKALKKCRTIRRQVRRRACARVVRKRYARWRQIQRIKRRAQPKAPKPGTVHRVDVIDTEAFPSWGEDGPGKTDYFSPEYLEIKVGDTIEWIWNDMNQNPHPISLLSSPPGISRLAFATPNAPSTNFRWSRRLPKAGTWVFVCPLHHQMTLTVKVGK